MRPARLPAQLLVLVALLLAGSSATHAGGKRAARLELRPLIAACLEVSREVEDRFEEFWKSLGMSVDWRFRYSTIDPEARRISQWSFIDLFRKGRVYRAQAPNPDLPARWRAGTRLQHHRRFQAAG